MEPISLTWINKETKLHNKINIITRQKAKKMSSENSTNKSTNKNSENSSNKSSNLLDLEKEANKQFDEKDKKDLSEPEEQFDKLRMKKSSGNINICMAIANTYRYLDKGKRQAMGTSINEGRWIMNQTITEAIRVSKEERPIIFAKNTGVVKKLKNI